MAWLKNQKHVTHTSSLRSGYVWQFPHRFQLWFRQIFSGSLWTSPQNKIKAQRLFPIKGVCSRELKRPKRSCLLTKQIKLIQILPEQSTKNLESTLQTLFVYGLIRGSSIKLLPNCDDLSSIKIDVIHLGDKNGSNSFVERSAIHVHSGSDGQHKASHTLINL